MTDVIRVATWNLWWRHGEWEARQVAIRRELETIGAAVLGLQEVSTAAPDHPSMLADLGFHVALAPDATEDRYGITNAIAVRWPIVETEWRYLDVGDDSVFSAGETDINFFNIGAVWMF